MSTSKTVALTAIEPMKRGGKRVEPGAAFEAEADEAQALIDAGLAEVAKGGKKAADDGEADKGGKK